MAARTDSAPCSCPFSRGRPRCFAPRPLPAMMMATGVGTFKAVAAPADVAWNLVLLMALCLSRRQPEGAVAPRPHGKNADRHAGYIAQPLHIGLGLRWEVLELADRFRRRIPAGKVLVHRLT